MPWQQSRKRNRWQARLCRSGALLGTFTRGLERRPKRTLSCESYSRSRMFDTFHGWDCGLIYEGLGGTEKLLAFLNKGAHAPWGRLSGLLVNPRHKPLRSDPRFQALIKRMFLGLQNPASLIGKQ